MELTISERLDRAADIIQRDGWHQGGYSAAGGWSQGSPVCALGALNQASGGLEIEAASRLITYLGASIVNWNDTPGRTAAEVIEVLRACAVIEQAREEQDAAWATYEGLVTA